LAGESLYPVARASAWALGANRRRTSDEAMGHFLWFILGGVFMGLVWWFVGLVAYVSVVGIPWGKACFVIGQFSFFPFGKEAIGRKELTLQGGSGTGPQARRRNL
jgi:uncharacterized membrane protein YccF (DUF307 family)